MIRASSRSRAPSNATPRREIRANNGATYQLADIANRLEEIYDIRFEIYNRKFFIKFLNNFIGSAALPLVVSGRRIGCVGPTSYLFSVIVRDNLFLGLHHHPGPTSDYDAVTAALRERAIEETRQSGNSDLDTAADWVDY